MNITSQQVRQFIADKAHELSKSAPGYSSLIVEACAHGIAEGLPPRAAITAYNQHCGHSPQFEEADEAIAWINKRVQGRRQSDMIRAKAAKLMLEAQELEASGK